MIRHARLPHTSGWTWWPRLFMSVVVAVIAFTAGELRRIVTRGVGSIRRAGGGTGSAAPGDPL